MPPSNSSEIWGSDIGSSIYPRSRGYQRIFRMRTQIFNIPVQQTIPLFLDIFFKMWAIFIKSLLNLLQYCLYVFWDSRLGILASRLGTELAPSALEGKVLTPGPPGKSSFFFPWFLYSDIYSVWWSLRFSYSANILFYWGF